MPIDVAGKIRGQIITDLQIEPGTIDTPAGTTPSQNEIVVVLGNGHQLKVRAFTDGKTAYLHAVDQYQVSQQDVQDLN